MQSQKRLPGLLPWNFIDGLAPAFGSPSSSLATPEDEGDWMPKHEPDRAPGDEVVAHDNEPLDLGASGPVDITLADETHSTVVHNPSSTGKTMSVLTGRMIPPRTSSIDLLAHLHKRLSRGAHKPSSVLCPTARRVRHTRASPSPIRPHCPSPTFTSRTIPPSPRFLLMLAFATTAGHIASSWRRRCRPAPQLHPRSHRSDTQIICTNWHRQSHPVRHAGLGYSLPQPKQLRACRRYLPTMATASACAGNGKRKRFT